MKEIEIKAHVYNENALRESISSFAVYKGSLLKEDVYYKAPGSPTIRFRTQTEDKKTSHIITYKRKELRKQANGLESEVNEEMECTVSDPEPLKLFLADAGFTVYLEKRKESKVWRAEVAAGKDNTLYEATLEICNVPPLGLFLEIEILSPVEKNAQAIQAALYKLLEKCGIGRDCVENRYYADMLREAALKKDNK